MESSVETTTTSFLDKYYSASASASPSLTSSPPPPPPPPPPPAHPTTIIMSPCAACKILRRRCAEKCVLAPYFPPTEPHKFTTAHRVFGASNIIKFLQELPESQRADAVSSMVYEANARIRDPVYGCAGTISQLQTQICELQAQLARTQAELINMQAQQANLVALICMEMANTTNSHHYQYFPPQASTSNINAVLDVTSPHLGFSEADQYGLFLEDSSNQLGSFLEEPLWT